MKNKILTLEEMTKQEFDFMMTKGYEEAINDKGIDAKIVFSKLKEKMNGVKKENKRQD